MPTGGGESQKWSRWERWGLSWSKEKVSSQPSIPSSLLREEGPAAGRPHVPSESGRCSPGISGGCTLLPRPDPPSAFQISHPFSTSS